MNKKYEYIVYKTTNIINNKIYIGVHKHRIGNPVKYLGCGVYIGQKSKLNKKGFPSAVKKYGFENFKRETLFTYEYTEEGKKAAFKKEAELVNKDFLKRSDVYNISLGGKVPSGINERPCAKYALDGTFIEAYDSIVEASVMLDIPRSTLQRACQKSRYSSGFLWRYFDGDTSNIEPGSNLNEKRVFQFALNGEYISTYKSIAEAHKKTGISIPSIQGVCTGNHFSAGGFYWNYKKSFNYTPHKNFVIPIACYDDAGNFIQSFRSIKDASKFYNISEKNIRNCIRGKSKHTKKLRWRYFYGDKSPINALD